MKFAIVALALAASVMAGTSWPRIPAGTGADRRAAAPNLVTDNTESVLDNACSAECDFVTFAAPKLGGEDAHPLCNDDGRRAMREWPACASSACDTADSPSRLCPVHRRGVPRVWVRALCAVRVRHCDCRLRPPLATVLAVSAASGASRRATGLAPLQHYTTTTHTRTKPSRR